MSKRPDVLPMSYSYRPLESRKISVGRWRDRVIKIALMLFSTSAILALVYIKFFSADTARDIKSETQGWRVLDDTVPMGPLKTPRMDEDTATKYVEEMPVAKVPKPKESKVQVPISMEESPQLAQDVWMDTRQKESPFTKQNNNMVPMIIAMIAPLIKDVNNSLLEAVFSFVGVSDTDLDATINSLAGSFDQLEQHKLSAGQVVQQVLTPIILLLVSFVTSVSSTLGKDLAMTFVYVLDTLSNATKTYTSGFFVGEASGIIASMACFVLGLGDIYQPQLREMISNTLVPFVPSREKMESISFNSPDEILLLFPSLEDIKNAAINIAMLCAGKKTEERLTSGMFYGKTQERGAVGGLLSRLLQGTQTDSIERDSFNKAENSEAIMQEEEKRRGKPRSGRPKRRKDINQ